MKEKRSSGTRGLTYLISERQGKETDRKNEENVKK